jgi:hypothetical protein
MLSSSYNVGLYLTLLAKLPPKPSSPSTRTLSKFYTTVSIPTFAPKPSALFLLSTSILKFLHTMMTRRPHHIPGCSNFFGFIPEPAHHHPNVLRPTTPKTQKSAERAVKTPPPPPSPSQPSTPRAVRVRRPAIVSFDSRGLMFADGEDSITGQSTKGHNNNVRNFAQDITYGKVLKHNEDEATTEAATFTSRRSEDEVEWLAESEEHEHLNPTVIEDFPDHTSPIPNFSRRYLYPDSFSSGSFLSATRRRPAPLSTPITRPHSSLHSSGSPSKSHIRSSSLKKDHKTLMDEITASIHSISPIVTFEGMNICYPSRSHYLLQLNNKINSTLPSGATSN